MLLHKDGLIELNYEVATDILTVCWPDMTGFTRSEIGYALQKLIDTLKHYDIKKLLIDARSRVVELPEEEYADLMLDFSRNLLSTRLMKVARLQTLDMSREKKVERATAKVEKQVQIDIPYKSFADEVSALAWLRED
ncbi:hypothetical protein [Pontibacter chitinilyticus]|uniref:hypothetical protein n=1 Tax=Pontibacter chitinilyticus TaxID=2674989 RepID=UPI00321BDEBC